MRCSIPPSRFVLRHSILISPQFSSPPSRVPTSYFAFCSIDDAHSFIHSLALDAKDDAELVFILTLPPIRQVEQQAGRGRPSLKAQTPTNALATKPIFETVQLAARLFIEDFITQRSPFSSQRQHRFIIIFVFFSLIFPLRPLYYSPSPSLLCPRGQSRRRRYPRRPRHHLLLGGPFE